MSTFTSHLTLLMLSLMLLVAPSCSDDDGPDTKPGGNDTGASMLCNYAWECRWADVNISPPEDYADLETQSLILYFLNDSQGVMRFNLDVIDTEGDEWGTKDEYSYFDYAIDGSYLTLIFSKSTDPSIKLKMGADMLYNDDFIYKRRSINASDRRHMPFSGSCGKSARYIYWPWGQLDIEGEGEMSDFKDGKQPWAGRKVTEVYADKSTITSVGAYFLKGFNELEWLQLPGTIQRIGAHAFEDCISLEYTRGSNFAPTEIDDYAFAGCTHLRVAPIEECRRIGDRAFLDCAKMSIIGGMTRLQEIGDYSFAGCTSIRTSDLQFPETLKKIGDCAFSGINLYKVTLPESLVSLGEGAFLSEKLETIYIGKNLKELADDTFITGATVGTITVNQSTPPSAVAPLSTPTITGLLKNWTLKVPAGASRAYKNDSYWSRYKIVEDVALQADN